jgi:hypothetical protein
VLALGGVREGCLLAHVSTEVVNLLAPSAVAQVMPARRHQRHLIPEAPWIVAMRARQHITNRPWTGKSRAEGDPVRQTANLDESQVTPTEGAEAEKRSKFAT